MKTEHKLKIKTDMNTKDNYKKIGISLAYKYDFKMDDRIGKMDYIEEFYVYANKDSKYQMAVIMVDNTLYTACFLPQLNKTMLIDTLENLKLTFNRLVDYYMDIQEEARDIEWCYKQGKDYEKSVVEGNEAEEYQI